MKRKEPKITREEAVERIREDIRYHRTMLSPRYIEALELAADELSKDAPVVVRQRGRWVKELLPLESVPTITCSACGEEVDDGPEIGVYYFNSKWRYCPFCGAEMVGIVDRRDKRWMNRG